VVFAPHNLLSDPPFSRIDLISCRNLLIYLQRDVQRDIIELFHYALKPKGYLLLGTAESVDTTELFQAVDKSSSLYFKRDVRTREPRLPVFPVTHAHVPSERRPQVTNAESLSYGTLHQRLVERNAPPSALISPDDNVVHLSDHAGRYLLPPGGEPTSNIYRLARKELQIELRTALHAVRKSKAGLDSKPVEVSFNGESGVVVLHVRPALEPGHEGFVLVTFDEQKSTELAAFRKALSAGEPGSAKENVARRQIGQLQTELSDTQQRLQAIIEEYETSQEEMKASNEEMQSTNEELRSTMEELETSKEELQSMNEELQTVNQENRHKVEELSQLSGDLQNLMSATDIATLFLDRDLRILRFTPRLGELFNVRMTDRGRPLTDLTHRLGYDELADDARRVLANLAPLEREVEDEEQRWYLTRLMPYRSPDDRIEGVVITLVDITGRKRAEQALALEVEAMRRLARLSVHLIDPDGSDVLHEQILNTAVSIARSDFASLQVCTSERGRNELRLIGHRGFDPASVRFWERVGPDSNSACGKALLDGERVEIEDITAASFMAGSEELRMLLAMGVRAVQTIPLLSRSGQLLGAFSTHWREVHAVSEAERRVLDVLARQAADLLERQRAEERSRRMMNVEGVAVLTFSADGALIGANDAFLRMTGYTREQVTSGSLSWQDLTPPQYAAEREKQQRVLQETGHVEPCELELILADGSRSWVLLADATLGDGTMVEYCIDVSDRKEAEAQVSEHERRFRLLVEQIRDYAIFMLDTDGRASTWNEGVRRVLGFREAEFVGLDITDQIFTPEDVADGVPQRELEQAAKAGSASNDRWMRRKDGTRFWASGITTGVRDEQGTLLGFMKVMRDQTGQKQLQEELRQAAEAVAESSRRKDEFLATLAHELRNPLAPIRTGLEILRNKRHDPQALGEVLAMIERQSEQLVALVDDLTDVSRITHGTFKLQRRRVELSEVVRIAVESARPFIEAARHELTLDLPDEPVQIDADPHRLAQVLSNLLNNAAKYTQEPGQIQLSSVTNDGIVEFRVRDSGIGIEPDQLEQIFETFFQVKSDESHNTGLGVGLALTKQLVHMHGGEIEARSAGLGRGSEFVVRLPIVCPDSVTRQKAANKPAENSSPLRVLVIDDNHDAATSLDLLVSALGHEVRIAGDGQQGIELARAFRPHVVFLDIGMPRMNGYEAARSIRQQDWGDDVVLVALTGWGQEEDVQRTREAGFDHHLVKPTNGDTLLALLAEVAAESGRAAASP
jgi:PAS domain S-box-containing protein